MSEAYDNLLAQTRRAGLINSSLGLLAWDQEVPMPPDAGAADYRGRQLAELARLQHELRTDPRVGHWLAECEADPTLTADPTSPAAVNLREIRRSYDRASKLPVELVAEFASACAAGKHAWKHAKANNDFAAFKPHLEHLIELNRRRAECWGWAGDGEPWDALAEGYEPGMTAAGVEKLFRPLADELTALLSEINASGRQVDNRLNELRLPQQAQRAFAGQVAEAIGFDFSRGRLHISAHPFCVGINRSDVRMTTRFQDTFMTDALGSTMHESGHGLYEQQLPGGEHEDTPMGEAVSLTVHESQSRLIENHLGRSFGFWQWCAPRLAAHFAGETAELTTQQMYEAANRVAPSLIRVEADEVTYNLHIIIRFELERALIRGDLSVADLPRAWNEKYRDMLGIEVPDEARGCLQDMHWSFGAMGYFPTYTLGTLYAAQFFEQAEQAMPHLHERFAAGEFQGLVDWLKQHVHQHGKRYRSEALCETITGSGVSTEPLLRHLRRKTEALYGAAV